MKMGKNRAIICGKETSSMKKIEEETDFDSQITNTDRNVVVSKVVQSGNSEVNFNLDVNSDSKSRAKQKQKQKKKK